MIYKFILVAIVSFFIVFPTHAREFIATIIKIQDGDTLTALVYNEETKIRLLDVDCYETKKNKRAKFQNQYYGISYDEIIKKGKHSKKELKKLLKDHRYIRVNWEKRDDFGRILGKVYLDDIKSLGVVDVNLYMRNHGKCNKYVPKTIKANK